jgi:hypothetical protein
MGESRAGSGLAARACALRWALSGASLVIAATTGSGCASAANEDAVEGATSEDISVSQHIAGGVERARLASAHATTTQEEQRASVHLGNASWLGQLSFLAYDNPTVITQQLKQLHFDTSQLHFFENTCTGAFGFYFTGDGFSALVFRGTEANWNDWSNNLESQKVPWAGGGVVHAGFLARFLSVWNADAKCGVGTGVKDLLADRHTIDPSTGKQKGGELYMTGHSMGAALATLALAATQAEVCHGVSSCTEAPNVHTSALYTFGSPKVGDQTFAWQTAALAHGRTPIYRFVNGDDIVTAIPRDLSAIEAIFSDYRHVSLEGEGEEANQVWMKDKEMDISTFVFHITYRVDDHLKYRAPLAFQASARHENH